MRLLTSFGSGLEFYLHFIIEKTQRTGKILIGDGFDKTLKLQYLKWGGPMGCLYDICPQKRRLQPVGSNFFDNMHH
mgnify:CR=1 FL=1